MAAIKYLDQAGLSVLWSKIKEQDFLYQQVFGYYMNEKFYTDSTYQVELEKSTKHIYIDKNGTGIYYYDNTYHRAIQEANGDVPGILKLYTSHGQNTDGTMTQKEITTGVNSIALKVDDNDSECVILDLPWD